MVLYKDNKELKKLSTVTTAKGDIEYRRNTKYIKEKYYTIGRDCVQIEDKWYRVDGGNIIFDHEMGTYVLRDRKYGMVNGLVLVDGKLDMGYFTPNVFNNVTANSRLWGKVTAINSEILEKNGWFEDLGSNIWYEESTMSRGDVIARKTIRNERNFTDRGYNIEDNQDFEKKVDLYEKYPTVITDKAKEMAKYLGDLTFGVEIELRAGMIGNHLKNRYGAVVCRDGSLNGGAEIVTIPLGGAKGLQNIVNLADDLKHRSEIGIECSLHIHFGNLRTDKLSIIALYKLARSLQSEIFTMFPYYKTDPGNLKQKNYTKKLLKLNINSLKDNSREAYELYLMDSWTKLFDFFAEGHMTIDQFDKRTRRHPIERKWERKSRYYYFNFLNLFFGHRHTAEMRLHSGTTNSHKIINWLFICVAIIRYAEKYSMQIITSDKTISLKEVLEVFPAMFPTDQKAHFLSKYLYEYFLERQARCKKDLERNDYVSQWDITEDKGYTFKYMGVQGLI